MTGRPQATVGRPDRPALRGSETALAGGNYRARLGGYTCGLPGVMRSHSVIDPVRSSCAGVSRPVARGSASARQVCAAGTGGEGHRRVVAARAPSTHPHHHARSPSCLESSSHSAEYLPVGLRRSFGLSASRSSGYGAAAGSRTRSSRPAGTSLEETRRLPVARPVGSVRSFRWRRCVSTG